MSRPGGGTPGRRFVTVVAVLAVGACSGQLRFDENAPAPPGGCTKDSDCPTSTLYCDTVSGNCVACVNDSQCTDPSLPRCDSALHQCVACGVDADCPTGQRCDDTTRTCVSVCGDGGACPASAPICDATRGICVACQGNADCASASGHICATGSGQCVQCTANSNCSGATPYCNPTGNHCVACLQTSQCGLNFYCDPVTHTCHDE